MQANVPPCLTWPVYRAIGAWAVVGTSAIVIVIDGHIINGIVGEAVAPGWWAVNTAAPGPWVIPAVPAPVVPTPRSVPAVEAPGRIPGIKAPRAAPAPGVAETNTNVDIDAGAPGIPAVPPVPAVPSVPAPGRIIDQQRGGRVKERIKIGVVYIDRIEEPEPMVGPVEATNPGSVFIIIILIVVVFVVVPVGVGGIAIIKAVAIIIVSAIRIRIVVEIVVLRAYIAHTPDQEQGDQQRRYLIAFHKNCF